MRGKFLVPAICLSGLAHAQTPAPSPTPAADGTVVVRPQIPPLDAVSKTARLPGSPRASTGSTADAGSLKEVRAISIGSGEARLLVAGAPRTVRAGQSLLGDVIRAIGDGRIVLARAESTGGQSVVVMSFDAQGRATVRVIALQDRTARSADKQ